MLHEINSHAFALLHDPVHLRNLKDALLVECEDAVVDVRGQDG